MKTIQKTFKIRSELGSVEVTAASLSAALQAAEAEIEGVTTAAGLSAVWGPTGGQNAPKASKAPFGNFSKAGLHRANARKRQKQALQGLLQGLLAEMAVS